MNEVAIKIIGGTNEVPLADWDGYEWQF
jgi:hypothetical protein